MFRFAAVVSMAAAVSASPAWHPTHSLVYRGHGTVVDAGVSQTSEAHVALKVGSGGRMHVNLQGTPMGDVTNDMTKNLRTGESAALMSIPAMGMEQCVPGEMMDIAEWFAEIGAATIGCGASVPCPEGAGGGSCECYHAEGENIKYFARGSALVGLIKESAPSQFDDDWSTPADTYKETMIFTEWLVDGDINDSVFEEMPCVPEARKNLRASSKPVPSLAALAKRAFPFASKQH